MKKLIFILLFIPSLLLSQDISIIEYNADFNKQNSIIWIDSLEKCTVKKINIQSNPTVQKINDIQNLPVLVIYLDGIEVKRFKGNIMMEFKFTREEIQKEINKWIID